MISKAEAVTLADSMSLGFLDRTSNYLTAQARAGVIGGAVSYLNEKNRDVLLTVTIMTNAGWTVVHDAPGKTITFS